MGSRESQVFQILVRPEAKEYSMSQIMKTEKHFHTYVE